MESTREEMKNCRTSHAYLSGSFHKALTTAALQDLTSIEHPLSYGANVVLFAEKEEARGLFVVLEGEVRLSINSTDGKRLSLRIARKGDILGLASTLTGNPYEMTAETLYPSKLAPIGRRDFLSFIARHPEVYEVVTRELSRNVTMACEQLRTVALSASAPEKLARLLLDWSEEQMTESGGRIRFSMTHEQIGEFIGASRETVTRTLSIFKSRRLVSFKGSILTIPSRTALASCARA